MGYDKTILVIEDSKPLNRILCFDLEQAGFQTLSAFNGKDGYEKAIEAKPHLILLDVNLPLMNGFEVCWKIKAHPHIKRVPIIMLTGRSQQRDFEEAKDTAVDAYIIKPYKQELLIEKIRELLRIKD
ncbi:MAG: response regulator [Candidatus Aureabacteria bacterium]|nr:response regulator [Candidatus Auribacterota bacterium]